MRRPPLAKLREIPDEEAFESQFAGVLDPEDPQAGIVPASWRLRRLLTATELDALPRFVDLASPQTHQYLRRAFSSETAELGFQDLDFSTMIGPARRLTQFCARHIYDLHDGNGVPSFDGIRYLSRLNPDWECWAVFSDRMIHMPGVPQTLFPDNPDLLSICTLFKLSIETIDGLNHYTRP